MGVSQVALASTVFFDASKTSIDVLLDTQNESVNAIEGSVTFNADMLQLQEIKTNNSFISLWVQGPQAESSTNIVFSGIVPGGYRGSKGVLFSFTFLPKKAGPVLLSFNNVKAYLNDGQGTQSLVKNKDTNFEILPADLAFSHLVSTPKDITPPELFTPEVSSSPDISSGKYFLVFSAQDKESGIKDYQIKEVKHPILSPFSTWIQVANPYILQDQSLSSFIFVKARDGAGNERIISLSPSSAMGVYQMYVIWFIIIVIALAVIMLGVLFSWKKFLIK